MDGESNSGFWSFVRSLCSTSTSSTSGLPESNLTHHQLHHRPHQPQHKPAHNSIIDHGTIGSDRRPPKRVRFSDTSAENDGDPNATGLSLENGHSNDELCPATQPRVAVAQQFGWRSSPFYRDRKRSHLSSCASKVNIPTFSKFNWSSRRVF